MPPSPLQVAAPCCRRCCHCLTAEAQQQRQSWHGSLWWGSSCSPGGSGGATILLHQLLQLLPPCSCRPLRHAGSIRCRHPHVYLLPLCFRALLHPHRVLPSDAIKTISSLFYPQGLLIVIPRGSLFIWLMTAAAEYLCCFCIDCGCCRVPGRVVSISSA